MPRDLSQVCYVSTELIGPSPRKRPKILRGGAVAARQAHNLKVGGSNPSPATKKIFSQKVENIKKNSIFVFVIKQGKLQREL